VEPNNLPPAVPAAPAVLDDRTRSAKNIALVCYVLHIVGVLFTAGTATLIAVIINYIKRPDAQGTFVFSHHNWLISTFWWSLLWWVLIGVIVIVTFGFGWLIMWIPALIWFVWFLYRTIKGLLRLNEDRAVE
jgi:uncharacterized membrane protein